MAEPTIYAIARRFREELLRQERSAAMEMARRYGEIWRRIKSRLDDLEAEYAALEEPPGPGWLFEQRRLEDLQCQVEAEMAQYAAWVEREVRAQQERAIQLALQMEQEMGLRLDWDRLNVQALQDIVGFTQEGSPLRELLDELGAEASETIRRELIAGLALGKNPAETARQIRSALGGNLVRALRISRTETLRAFREATLRGYQEDDNVARWQWVSAKSERTCAACLAMDGTVHSKRERLDDHPNGRCVMVPVLAGEEPAEYETGEEWFDRQPPDVQEKVLGKAGSTAYRSGAVTLHDFVGHRETVGWGTTITVRSLRDIVGSREAKRWGERAAFAGRLRGLSSSKVLPLGNLQDDLLSAWPTRVTNAVVITGERRGHYLGRHPEMVRFEGLLPEVAVHPDEIHRNRRDAQVALLYKRFGDKYLRVALWISDIEGLSNSVLSYRLAEMRELVRGRADGRSVWQKR